jgi:hypothetical protein
VIMCVYYIQHYMVYGNLSFGCEDLRGAVLLSTVRSTGPPFYYVPIDMSAYQVPSITRGPLSVQMRSGPPDPSFGMLRTV